MAKASLGAWFPVTTDPTIAGVQPQPSAFMQVAGPARFIPGDSVNVPRLTDAVLGVGCDLTDGGSVGDTVPMHSVLINGKETICDADLAAAQNGNVSVIQAFDANWLTKFHVAFDNAAIGVAGAYSSTQSDRRPFDSILSRVLTASTGYTAGDNHTLSATLTYDAVNAALGLLEGGRYFNRSSVVILAHPTLLSAIRGMKDTAGNPIWQAASGELLTETLMGYPIRWTQGAIRSTNFNMTSVTNPLFVAVNREYLAWGQGIAAVGAPAGPVSRVLPSTVNTDSVATTLQYIAKVGATQTVPQAASVLEIGS